MAVDAGAEEIKFLLTLEVGNAPQIKAQMRDLRGGGGGSSIERDRAKDIMNKAAQDKFVFTETKQLKQEEMSILRANKEETKQIYSELAVAHYDVMQKERAENAENEEGIRATTAALQEKLNVEKAQAKGIQNNINAYGQLRGTLMGLSFSGFMVSMMMKNLGIENEKATKIASTYAAVMTGVGLVGQIVIPIMELYAKSQWRVAQGNVAATSTEMGKTAPLATNTALSGIAAGISNPLMIPFIIGGAALITYAILKATNSFAVGGRPTKAGMYQLHEGEEVIPANENKFNSMGGSGLNIYGNVTIQPSGMSSNEIARELNRQNRRGA